MEKINLDELRIRLNMPISIVAGMVRAGLFGITDSSGNILISSIESYEKYGTQWSEELNERLYPYTDFPEVSGWKNAPIGTFTELQISQDKEFESNDNCWIAQLYIRPNKFFFPDPENMALIGSCSIQLEKKVHIHSDDYIDKIFTLYPYSDGSLALISVFGKGKEADRSPLDIAMEMALPILSELSFRADRSIHISQKHWISLPSGTINIETKKIPKNYQFNLQDFKDYHSLREAKSLYFSALNCNETMSQFLSFYRAIESVRNQANKYLQADRKPHKIPNHPAYGDYQGKKITAGADTLKAKFRNAIAHGDDRNDVVISENTREEYRELILVIPLVRFIAREYINIVENGLKKTDTNYSPESKEINKHR